MNFAFNYYLLLLFFFFLVSLRIASTLEKCAGGDQECLAGKINEYVKSYHEGLKSINLVSLDPLFIEKVDIIQGSDSPVNVNLNFKNVSMFGLSHMNIYKVV